MDFITHTLFPRLSHPPTVLALAVFSFSTVALFTSFYRDNRIPLVIESNEADSKRSSEHNSDGTVNEKPEKAIDITEIVSTLSCYSRSLLGFQNRKSLKKDILSDLSLEISQLIAMLCQIQQQEHSLNDKPSLKLCVDSILTGLATACYAADNEKCNDLEDRFHETLTQLQSYRPTIAFVIDQLKGTESSLYIGKTSHQTIPEKELEKGFESWANPPPETEQLPAYSPPLVKKVYEAKKILSRDSSKLEKLHIAISSADIEETRVLLELNIDPNAPFGRLQRTPLHEAARRNHSECVGLLIQHGALANVEDAKGDTPLHLAAWEGHVHIMKVLLEHGGEIDRLSGRDGSTPLWCAISGRHSDLVQMLLSKGANVNIRNPAELSLLHQAAVTSQSRVCQLLIDRGANASSGDGELNSPLHYAATVGSLQTAHVLIAAGADVDAVQISGMTPMHWAAHKNHYKVVDLLIKSGANVNVQSEEHVTPLHCASRKGHMHSTRILLENGSDPALVGCWDGLTGTPAEIARKSGHSQVAAIVGFYSKGK